jgi:hypothetical protein
VSAAAAQPIDLHLYSQLNNAQVSKQ